MEAVRDPCEPVYAGHLRGHRAHDPARVGAPRGGRGRGQMEHRGPRLRRRAQAPDPAASSLPKSRWTQTALKLSNSLDTDRAKIVFCKTSQDVSIGCSPSQRRRTIMAVRFVALSDLFPNTHRVTLWRWRKA